MVYRVFMTRRQHTKENMIKWKKGGGEKKGGEFGSFVGSRYNIYRRQYGSSATLYAITFCYVRVIHIKCVAKKK
jgi:hypothetical protein